MADIEHPPGSRWTDPAGYRVYTIDDRPCGWPGLVPAKLNGLPVLLREDDFGRRLRLLTRIT